MWWLAWLILALILGVVEFLTLTLAFGLLAGAALAAAVAAGLGAAVPVQLLVFAVTGGVGLVAVRPIAKRHLALPPLSREGSDALVGRPAVVTREVTSAGDVVHLSGEDWSARPYVDGTVIPAGVQVDVLEIEGATALVHPRDALLEPQPRET
jgi:membrane protein implicated in regulation of membrane protease activity